MHPHPLYPPLLCSWVPATIEENGGKVYLVTHSQEYGALRTLYCESAEFFYRMTRRQVCTHLCRSGVVGVTHIGSHGILYTTAPKTHGQIRAFPQPRRRSHVQGLTHTRLATLFAAILRCENEVLRSVVGDDCFVKPYDRQDSFRRCDSPTALLDRGCTPVSLDLLHSSLSHSPHSFLAVVL